jgi:hypothetical protein
MLYAVHDSTGRLVSTGTVVADPLPAGLTARLLTDQEAAWLNAGGCWDSAACVVCEPPMPAAPGVMDDVTPWQIRLALLDRGWPAAEVDEVFVSAAGIG